ncbi:DNA-processing protein DprA [Bradyrhizobium sp.]|uniref:DNA-processing protein DprA n=1 Tax=Bradyrhizobium sp. TaxID=376 RepID=UPI0039E411E5
MIQFAAKARRDDPEMTLTRSKYVGPAQPQRTNLAHALDGTNRLPDSRQGDWLGNQKSIGDQILHYAGDLSLLTRPCVSIVGTREVSEAGKKATDWLARKLSGQGVVIVSGLAYGVDTVAHSSTIDAGGSTVAVIATPLDKATPSENAELQTAIYERHLLISQFAPGERTHKSSFPLRNRLMATISDATVVMEASDTSGTLHQAAECTRLGRWLFISKAVVDNPRLTWPHRFLKYDTCVVLERVSQITDRLLDQSNRRAND